MNITDKKPTAPMGRLAKFTKDTEFT